MTYSVCSARRCEMSRIRCSSLNKEVLSRILCSKFTMIFRYFRLYDFLPVSMVSADGASPAGAGATCSGVSAADIVSRHQDDTVDHSMGFMRKAGIFVNLGQG